MVAGTEVVFLLTLLMHGGSRYLEYLVDLESWLVLDPVIVMGDFNVQFSCIDFQQ